MTYVVSILEMTIKNTEFDVPQQSHIFEGVDGYQS
jgi:hypothetical protein